MALLFVLVVTLGMSSSAFAQRAQTLRLHHGGLLKLMARAGCNSSQLEQVMIDNNITQDQLMRLPRNIRIHFQEGCGTVASASVAERSREIIASENEPVKQLHPAAITSNTAPAGASVVSPQASSAPAAVSKAPTPQTATAHHRAFGMYMVTFVALVEVFFLLFLKQKEKRLRSSSVVIQLYGKEIHYIEATPQTFKCPHCSEKNLLRHHLVRHASRVHPNLYRFEQKPPTIIDQSLCDAPAS